MVLSKVPATSTVVGLAVSAILVPMGDPLTVGRVVPAPGQPAKILLTPDVSDIEKLAAAIHALTARIDALEQRLV